MELLNGVGEPITPEFNNRLIHQSGQKAKSPTWLKAQLTEDELTRLSGAPRIRPPEVEPKALAKAVAKPVSPTEIVSESPNRDEAKPDSGLETTLEAKPVAEAETVAETKKMARTLIESDSTASSTNDDALVDAQDTTEKTDESANAPAPDFVGKNVVSEEVVSEEVVGEEVVGEDTAPQNEPRASGDQAPLLQRDKPSMPVPSASEERLIPTSRLGGSARELLNDDGSLRKP